MSACLHHQASERWTEAGGKERDVRQVNEDARVKRATKKEEEVDEDAEKEREREKRGRSGRRSRGKQAKQLQTSVKR